MDTIERKKSVSVILRVGTYPTVERPGMGYHSYKIGNASGFETVFLAPENEETPLPTLPGVRLLKKKFLMTPKPINASPVTKGFFLARRLWSIINFSMHGVAILVRERCDCVHIHSPMFMFVAFVAMLLKRPAYITYHGTDFYRIADSRIYALFGRIYTTVFALSPRMIPRLNTIHGSLNVRLVRNGVDAEVFANLRQKRNKVILAVGSLKKEKGFDTLINAFNQFRHQSESHEAYTLKIVGEGVLREDLQMQIESLGLQKNVTLHGHAQLTDLIELYNEAEIFVLSSISEGFPKVLLEAISCGCKVVTTNVGSVSAILPEYPFTARIDDEVELSKMLGAVIGESHSCFEQLYDGVIASHAWHHVSAEYFKEYEKTIF